MTDPLEGLSERIKVELGELEQVLVRIEQGWQRACHSEDDFYLDSVALNLHGLYSGLERIFQRIAEILDGDIPKGENWHKVLLTQMAKDVPGIRPAVISLVTCQRLDEYRGFQHVVRNVYTYHFDPAKLEKLVMGAADVYSQTRTELLAFAGFLHPHTPI
jgi:hypothetical protein